MPAAQAMISSLVDDDTCGSVEATGVGYVGLQPRKGVAGTKDSGELAEAID